MNKIIAFVFFILMLAGCRDKYDMELKPSDKSLLVVEGVLNTGQGPTNIRLTQSVNLTDPTQIKPVLQATVSVESENGDVYPLASTGNGNYSNNQLPLVTGQEYRLRILTSGKEYLSDYVEARQTPALDSVTWKRTADGVLIYASTHDPSNNTRYYKWEFDETWEIRSFYTATYLYIGGNDIVFTGSPVNDRCWKYANSTTINIGSTAQLQSDVLSEAAIHFIPNGSERISYRYSILVKQQALTKAAYEYFQLMKKNTESIGTIFDPQPSELKGNIKCISDPAEGVVGYLTASNTVEQRIFIRAVDANWSYQQFCPSIEVDNHPDSISAWVPSYLPWGAMELVPGAVDYYYMAPAVCVDCTKRGGSLAMPSYW